MDYKIGDQVVHWTFGVGSVIAIEEIHIAGMAQWYYVIEVAALKLWVPLEEALKGALRFPLGSLQFQSLLDILRLPGQPLSDRFFQRQTALQNRMQKRTLEALCQVIRDLTDRARHHPLSWEDSTVLTSAKGYLLDEWVISLGIERSTALREMGSLLQ